MQSAPRGGTPRGALCLSMPSFAENSVKRLDRAQSPRLTLRGDESASPKERRRSGTLAGDGDSNEQSVLQASEFVCLSFGSMSKYAPAAKCRGRVFVRKGGKRFAGAFIRWGERRLCCGIAGEYAASFSAAFAETPAAKSHKSSRGGRAPPPRLSLAVPACRPAARAGRQGPPPCCACRRLSASRRTNRNAPRPYAPQGVWGGRNGARPAQPLSKAGL